MAEETIKFNVEYDIRNVDQTVRQTQRVLYAMNSIRLSITDFQRLMEKPTLENAMWLAINLTQTWRSIVRLINAANAASSTGNLVNLLGGGVGGGIGRGIGNLAGGVAQGALTSTAGGALTSTAGAAAGTWTASAVGRAAAGGAGGAFAGGAVGGLLAQTVFALAMINPVTLGLLGAAAVVGGAYMIQWNNERMFNDWKINQREIAKSQGLEY